MWGGAEGQKQAHRGHLWSLPDHVALSELTCYYEVPMNHWVEGAGWGREWVLLKC